MQTVPTLTTNVKAFYATFHGLSGVITLSRGVARFLEPETSAVVTLGAADVPHLVKLGAVDLAMAQYVSDMDAGGYAAVACGRDEGRA